MRAGGADPPEPGSRFNTVRCAECSEIQVVYSHASTVVRCNTCGNVLASPTGSLARINGQVIRSY